MIKVGSIQKALVLWQAVFLTALLLAISGSAAKTLFCVPTIPLAMQANADLTVFHEILVRTFTDRYGTKLC